MDRIGNQLLKESKATLVEANGKKDERFKKRDLLSLLLKANLSTDIPESQKMNDRDVLARKFFLPSAQRLEMNILQKSLRSSSLVTKPPGIFHPFSVVIL